MENETSPEILAAEKAEWRRRLNESFKNGANVFNPEILAQLRRAEFPMVVDFNNVLFGNSEQIKKANPEAADFLKALSGIGEIFVVTAAHSWEKIWAHFAKNGLEKNIILLVNSNYYVAPLEMTPEQEAVIDEFTEKVHRLGLAEEFEMPDKEKTWQQWGADLREGRRLYFQGSVSNKKLAPIFDKTFRVPIVDEARFATSGNPGMIGYKAKHFEGDNLAPTDIDLMEDSADLPTLREIAGQIAEYKKSLNASGRLKK
jgi:hypothetical protein